MLDDGPLLAPSCCRLPPTLDPVKIYDWVYRLDVHLIDEIFTLSSKSVLYEMAVHCLQRPWQRKADPDGGRGLAALIRYFAESQCRFEHNSVLAKCRLLFINHLEAGLSCIRFHPVLENLLPPDGAQHSTHCIDRSVPLGPVFPLGPPMGQCVAEAVDREKWVFRDVDDALEREGSIDGPAAGTGRRLRLGADAKLACTVTLFVWAAVRLLARRIEMLLEFPSTHPLFAQSATQGVPKVSSLGDSLSALLQKRTAVAQRAVELHRQGDLRGALAEFTRAIAMPPDEGKYFLFKFRANCHFHLRELDAAVEDCTTALSRNAHAFAPRYLRARANQALGRLDTAAEDLTHLLRLYPDSGEVQRLQAELAEAIPALRPRDAGRPEPPATPPDEETGPHSASAPASPLGEESPQPSYGCDPDTPLTTADVGSISFANLNLNLTSLPAYPEPPDADDPPYIDTGQELKYRVCCGKELGRGASSRVYKAVHLKGGWFMAVKEFEAKHLDGDDESLSAFEQMTAMKHTNVVRCLGMRRLPGFYHMVMEFCSGGSLRSLIDDLGGLPPSLMRKYATEVLLGLRYTHRHGLLHRDIKATNILLSHDGTAKIADFGTCMRLPEGSCTRCDAVKGTVLWMAPETFRGRYCAASDVWSFGCTLIEMATAKDPWHEQQFREPLTAMVFIATRPDALPVTPCRFSDDLGRHFFHSCIARNPAERCSADLLLRHPWLSRGDPDGPSTPTSPLGACSLQSHNGRDVRDATGFPWTTSSSLPETSFSTTASTAFPRLVSERASDAPEPAGAAVPLPPAASVS
eukprot:EG_transcript_2390